MDHEEKAQRDIVSRNFENRAEASIKKSKKWQTSYEHGYDLIGILVNKNFHGIGQKNPVDVLRENFDSLYADGPVRFARECWNSNQGYAINGSIEKVIAGLDQSKPITSEPENYLYTIIRKQLKKRKYKKQVLVFVKNWAEKELKDSLPDAPILWKNIYPTVNLLVQEYVRLYEKSIMKEDLKLIYPPKLFKQTLPSRDLLL